MAHHFVSLFNGIAISVGQIMVFDYHATNLRAKVTGVSLLELADEQTHGGGAGGKRYRNMETGLLMDKTDVSFVKAADSSMKIKSSAKKYVCRDFQFREFLAYKNLTGQHQMPSLPLISSSRIWALVD